VSHLPPSQPRLARPAAPAAARAAAADRPVARGL